MTNSSLHATYMQKCISLAEQSPPRPTNFRVGAILLSRKEDDPTGSSDKILSTGYTMELAGNTHAEQCCLSNFAAVHNVPEDQVASVLPAEPGRKLIMYVTMEPCGKRLSGNAPCVQRITRTREGGRAGIHKVYFGVKEPGTFVGASEGCKMLTAAGIEWEHVGGFEREILTVATAGHENAEAEVRAALGEGEKESQKETNVDDISPEERRRQEQIPRNPKKRMMEGETLLY
ncbi:Putative Cytidine and deoxycytidylate deaminase zinc-binding domain protein [Penicillium brasilianum]|uniref:Putative Cytidine and deoxycytidylate deaminase zinc-binding domain protein n=1 Tax=Penicillium brasilianum TaxID=104259 RepID=A0A0F7VHF5_PENBI|nr:Putative Cytidine and deoxycytidylate deaminase zinc-binding domain protein [Penicillium brasilianum]